MRHYRSAKPPRATLDTAIESPAGMSLAAAFPKMEPATPIRAWNAVPPLTARGEIHGAVVRDFEPLLTLKKLHSLIATCTRREHIETVGQLKNLKTLSLKHHAGTLAPLSDMTGLRALKLDVFTGTLDGIERLSKLEYLSIYHAPKLQSLAQLAKLHKLKWLSISIAPSWIPSRKTIKVESFAPLTELTALRYLELDGVEPKISGLAPLRGLKSLREVEIGHVHTIPLADYAKLAAALPRTKGHCLRASYSLPQLDLLRCKKCGGPFVWLTAPARGAKATPCPSCDALAVAKHNAEFERLKAQAAKTLTNRNS